MEYLRDDAIHKATTKLTALADTITIETLDIKGMVGPKKSGKRQKSFNRSLHNVAMGEIHRQIEYKTGWYGTTLIKASRYYPSLKNVFRMW